MVTVVVAVAGALAPYARVDQRTGRICVDPSTGRCEWWTDVNSVDDNAKELRPRPPVWCGGDASCVTGSTAEPSQTTVESANDGKTAAYHIHQYLQVTYGHTRAKFNRPRPTVVSVRGSSRTGIWRTPGTQADCDRKSERNDFVIQHDQVENHFTAKQST